MTKFDAIPQQTDTLNACVPVARSVNASKLGKAKVKGTPPR